MEKINKKSILFLVPFLVLYLTFTIIPVFYGFFISFFKWGITGPIEFSGMNNYFYLLKDPQFWQTLRNSTLFVIISTPSIIAVAFLLALACNRNSKWSKVFKASFFLPSVLSVTVISYMGIYLFNPSIGLVNTILRSLKLLDPGQSIEWLGQTGTAWFVIVLMTIWWTLGTNMLLILAALQEIPDSFYEVAKLDGASKWEQLKFIIFPSLKPILRVITILQIIASYKVFPQIYYMTKGGPNNSTKPIVQYIYEQAFLNDRVGYAITLSIPLFILLFGLSLFQLYLGQRKNKGGSY